MDKAEESEGDFGRMCECGHYQIDHNVNFSTELGSGGVQEEWKNCLHCSCKQYVAIKKKWEFWR